MICVKGWWFPDGELHIPQQMVRDQRLIGGRLTYQSNKYKHVLPYCRRRNAVDAGAHVGMWTYLMTGNFTHVIAFEPDPTHVACWLMNLDQQRRQGRAELYACALGATTGLVGLERYGESSGNTRITDGDGVVQRTLDSFELENVDFFKIDCEGYELYVLDGAQRTLRRCRPTVLVEQKGEARHYGELATAAVNRLVSLGAAVVWDAGGDYLLAFPEAVAWATATKS